MVTALRLDTSNDDSNGRESSLDLVRAIIFGVKGPAGGTRHIRKSDKISSDSLQEISPIPVPPVTTDFEERILS